MNILRLKETYENVSKELTNLKIKASNINKKIVFKKRELQKLEHNLAKYESKEIEISDHALVRYIERVKGVDITAIKKEILSDKNIVKAIKTLDNGEFPMSYGKLVVKDKVIVTILT